MAFTQDEVNQLFKQMRQLAKSDLCNSKLSKFQVRDAFQAIDDNFEANRLSIKTDIETAIGESISNQLAKKLGKAWLAFKVGGE